MPRQVTKAAANVYCQARLRAAEFNEDFCARATAVNHLPGVTEDSLKKYELDITRPPNIVVALMADAYNAPELRSWYCSNECPLGKNCREIDDMTPERAAIRLRNSILKSENALEEFFEILEDGKITISEMPRANNIKDNLLELRRRLDEALAMLEKAQKSV